MPTNGAPRRGTSGGTNPIAIVAIVVVGAMFVVAIIGILAAIAIPNLLTAMQRSRQKRTVADIRLIGTVVESYAVDNNAYPRAESMDELKPLIEPKYTAHLPKLDGWGNELRYRCTDNECKGYAISSSGADRIFEHVTAGEYEGGATSNFNSDIVWVDGKFVQYPEGVQR
ncbi:MAG TPA: type II secretion system protein GspG [Thermoanaerobaculia bacterium]|nr:type II secretion system protein GspG [Thermoanaerobaculia bacterium]